MPYLEFQVFRPGKPDLRRTCDYVRPQTAVKAAKRIVAGDHPLCDLISDSWRVRVLDGHKVVFCYQCSLDPLLKEVFY